MSPLHHFDPVPFAGGEMVMPRVCTNDGVVIGCYYPGTEYLN